MVGKHMANVLTVNSIQEVERNWGLTDPEGTWPLMVRAAKSFVRQYLRVLTSGTALIVVGPGNNGGDGYLIGKYLVEEGCAPILVNPLGPPRVGSDADQARQLFLTSGGIEHSSIPEREFSVVVDALFGTGLNRTMAAEPVQIINRINQCRCPIYSVDIPSGIQADSGLPMPVSVLATATHSFIAYSAGQLTNVGPLACGDLTLDRLGLESASQWRFDQSLQYLPRRMGNTHKAKHGNVRVIGGHKNMPGAGLIAAHSALNAGAGRVFWHGNRDYLAAMLFQAAELMFAEAVTETQLQSSVVVIGPGLGLDQTAYNQVFEVLKAPRSKGVIDADALRLLNKVRESGASRPLIDWVLTPHEAEAAALLDWSVEEVQVSRAEACSALVEKYQAVVVLKGAGTIVGFGPELVFCHPGTPAMATPGMGDSLAGIIGALMAQGLAADKAAITGVNWHATVAAAISKRQRIVLASDIIDQLKHNISD